MNEKEGPYSNRRERDVVLMMQSTVLRTALLRLRGHLPSMDP